MTPRRAVFLDVDGTIVGEGGRVARSTIAAIRQARANGHLMFLCTGRTNAELWPSLVDIGFDGIIGAAGAWVTVGGQVLLEHTLPDAALAHAEDYFAGIGVDVYLQGIDELHAAPRVKESLRAKLFPPGADPAEFLDGPYGFVERIRTDGVRGDTRFTKVIYHDSPVSLDDLTVEFAGEFDIVPSSLAAYGAHSGEMMPAGVHKATGLDVIIAHLGLDRTDTIAVGDSFNDLELLAAAGIGIAMGNAPAEVQAVADDVTGHVDAGGLADAFARYGLS